MNYNRNMICYEQFIQVAHDCYMRHLTVASGGNISILTGDNVIITKSGCSLGHLTRSDLMTVPLSGRTESSSAENGTPSKELPLHLELYKTCKNCSAIIHVHPPYITAYSCAQRLFPRYTSSAIRKLPKVYWVKSAPAGSRELLENLRNMLHEAEESPRLFVIEKHGIFALGSNLLESFQLAELAEECARIAYFVDNIKQHDHL